MSTTDEIGSVSSRSKGKGQVQNTKCLDQNTGLNCMTKKEGQVWNRRLDHGRSGAHLGTHLGGGRVRKRERETERERGREKDRERETERERERERERVREREREERERERERERECAPRRLKLMSCIDRALGPCSFFGLKWERCNSSRSNTSSSGLRMS